MGTLVAVATRNSARTRRPLPDTAFAVQVTCDQGSQMSPNSRAALPTPSQVGSLMSSATIWE